MADKLELGNGSGFPFYVRSLNFTNDAIMMEEAIEVVGFVPELLQDDKVLSSFLNERGITLLGKQEEACKLNRKWIEQAFIDQISASIRECNEKGPVYVQINRGEDAFIVRGMPVFVGYTCK